MKHDISRSLSLFLSPTLTMFCALLRETSDGGLAWPVASRRNTMTRMLVWHSLTYGKFARPVRSRENSRESTKKF
jgi:hypothetical protein